MKSRNYSLVLLSLMVAAALCLPGCANNGNSANPGNASSSSGESSGSAGAKSGGLLSRIEGPKPVTIPAGTDIHVILGTTIDSGTALSGDSFDGTISEPIVIRGRTVAPRDARVKGTVVEARKSGRLSTPALLTVALTSIQTAGGWVDVRTDTETWEGKSHKKRDIVAIGGGSALGAIIGGIAGGGKGAAIGAGAGAGAGTAGAAFTGKKEISLPAESRLTFRLSRPVTVKFR
ncbi:MAG TPA: hypothetical protein VNF02_03110 [Candidatus Limnocylindrales bacterium]|nr:hypothetical protein [Candidatus Limnocylindrales bacterium]